MVRWDKICQPKECDGLGLRRSANMNRAMLAKTYWRLLMGHRASRAMSFEENIISGILLEVSQRKNRKHLQFDDHLAGAGNFLARDWPGGSIMGVIRASGLINAWKMVP